MCWCLTKTVYICAGKIYIALHYSMQISLLHSCDFLRLRHIHKIEINLLPLLTVLNMKVVFLRVVVDDM